MNREVNRAKICVVAHYALKHKVKIGWSSNFAYAIGLIASDGYLHPDGRHIFFCSKDLEMMENFKRTLGISERVKRYARGGEILKKYFFVSFSDKAFHQYLNSIGLTASKSKTIQLVAVPDTYFGDFLRGLFDGDGSFYTFWDRRWPNSLGFKLSFASASPTFLTWLREKLTGLHGTKGYFHRGSGVVNLEYTKGDTRKLFEVMYHSGDILFFRQKYFKLKTALEQDKLYGMPQLQKQRRGSSVVELSPEERRVGCSIHPRGTK